MPLFIALSVSIQRPGSILHPWRGENQGIKNPVRAGMNTPYMENGAIIVPFRPYGDKRQKCQKSLDMG
jgi:hypothetical protein